MPSVWKLASKLNQEVFQDRLILLDITASRLEDDADCEVPSVLLTF